LFDETLPFGRISKPQLSRLVLLATAFVVSTVLLIWLLLFLFIRGGGVVTGHWIAQRGVASPVLPYQADDLRRILGRSSTAKPRDAPSRDLVALLREQVARAGDKPAVIYVSAAGISDGRRAELLATNYRPALTARDEGQATLAADELLDALGDLSSRPRLLILDAGQVGTDRNIGVFGNGFVHRLATLLRERKPKGLAVLCSCAPGQVSWTSEADQQTVFGHYVAEGLSGKAVGWDPSARGLTVRALANYVREHVFRWVREQRQAQQTPLLLTTGEATNFLLRPSVKASSLKAEPVVSKADQALMARLEKGWTRRDELEAEKPSRSAPLLWRRYQETLLRAERLIRAGQSAEATKLLDDLAGLERGLLERAGGIPLGEPLSLALAGASWVRGSSVDREHVTAYRETMEAYLSELSGGGRAGQSAKVDTAPPPAPEGSPQAEPPPPSPGTGTPLKEKPDKVDDRGDSTAGLRAVAKLSATGAKDRPVYLEAQILIWAASFQERGGTERFGFPEFFHGSRFRALQDLVALRSAAEVASAGDERVRHRVAPLIEAGDTLRRKAQDHLFSGERNRGPDPGRDGVQAQRIRDLYERATQDSDLCARSLSLVQRLGVELPNLGEWLARRNARLGIGGLGPEFESLLDDTAALHDLVTAGPTESENGRSPRTLDDEALATHAARIQAIKTRYDRVDAAYGRLNSLFKKQCRELADADSPEQWREVDELLDVPTIPAGLRLQLVRRVRGTLASSLNRPTTEAHPPRGKDKAGAGETSEGDPGSDRDRSGDDASSNEADPSFWGCALAMARLEWGLFKLGGVPEGDLVRMEGAYQAARNATGGGRSGAAFDAFDELSAVIRSIHVGQVARIDEARAKPWASSALPDNAIYQRLVAADRASRALPLGYAASRSLDDDETKALDHFHRYALLLWHGRRLLEDFAVGHAQTVLDRARLVASDTGQATATPSLQEALDVAEARKAAKLTLQSQPADKLAINDWGEHPIKLLVGSFGDVPPGDASALIGVGPSTPVAVTIAGSNTDARAGTLAPVAPGRAPHEAGFLAVRIESSSEEKSFNLAPGAFYRGRFFPADRDLSVTMSEAAEPVSVAIMQSYRKFDKKIPDQFNLHPGKGFLHPGSNLAYRLRITNKTGEPMRVNVSYALEGQPEPPRQIVLEFTTKKPFDEITDEVSSQEVPVDRPKSLSVTVTKEGETTPLSRRNFQFQQVVPKEYFAVVPRFSPAEESFTLDVRRLRSDPVTGPVPVNVSIAGQTRQHIFQRAGESKLFSIGVSNSTASIPWSVTVEEVVDAFHGDATTHFPSPPSGASTTPP